MPWDRRIARNDEANVSMDYGYDANGRLSRVTDAAGNITSYSYDEAGDKLTQTDAEGRTTRWTYDAVGRQTSRKRCQQEICVVECDCEKVSSA